MIFGLGTGRRVRSPGAVLPVGMALVILLGGCGKEDQEAARLQETPPAVEPATALDEAGVDTGAVPTEASMAAAGTLTTGEGVSDDPAPAEPPAAAAEIKAAPPEEPVAGAPAPTRPQTTVSSAASGFSLQLGSFTSPANARRQVDRIKALGYSPVIEESDLGGQIYYRVMLRDVGDMAQASRLGEYLHSELGIAYLVRRGF